VDGGYRNYVFSSFYIFTAFSLRVNDSLKNLYKYFCIKYKKKKVLYLNIFERIIYAIFIIKSKCVYLVVITIMKMILISAMRTTI